MVLTAQTHATTVILHIQPNGEPLFLICGEDGECTEVSGSYGFESSEADQQARSLEWYARRVLIDAEYYRS